MKTKIRIPKCIIHVTVYPDEMYCVVPILDIPVYKNALCYFIPLYVHA